MDMDGLINIPVPIPFSLYLYLYHIRSYPHMLP